MTEQRLTSLAYNNPALDDIIKKYNLKDTELLIMRPDLTMHSAMRRGAKFLRTLRDCLEETEKAGLHAIGSKGLKGDNAKTHEAQLKVNYYGEQLVWRTWIPRFGVYLVAVSHEELPSRDLQRIRNELDLIEKTSDTMTQIPLIALRY